MQIDTTQLKESMKVVKELGQRMKKTRLATNSNYRSR